jgi:hypothetical protein
MDIDFSDITSTAVWEDAFTMVAGLTKVNIEIVQENRPGNKVKWELDDNHNLMGKLEVSPSNLTLGGRHVQTLVCSKDRVHEDFATISLNRIVMVDGTDKKIDLVTERVTEAMLTIGLPVGNILRYQMKHPFESYAAVMPGQRIASQNWRSFEFEALQNLRVSFSVRIVGERRVHFD